MAGRRDKKSYDNFKGNGYAQVAISTTVRLDRQSSMLVALGIPQAMHVLRLSSNTASMEYMQVCCC